MFKIPSSDVDQAKTYQDQAYQHIKVMILQRKFSPGQYFSDKEIADRLKMSRTPVKAALSLLEHEGLVLNERRRGWKVLSLSMEDIHQIFELKIAIESMLVKKAACQLTSEEKSNLQDILTKMKIAAERDDYDLWISADVDFHNLLYTHADNPRAYRIIQNLNEQWNRVWVGIVAMEGRIQQALREHEAIAQAVIQGEGEEAEFKMREHLTLLQTEVEQVLRDVVFPFTDNFA
jgi:DNA-binding GntR family transcriptional regulator